MSSSIQVTRDDVDRLYSFAFSKRLEKQAQWKETGIGALGGAGLGALLGYLTPRDKDESRVDRFLRYILGGAAMGGIAGLGYGSSKDFLGAGGGSNGGSSVDKKPPEPNNPSWLPQRATNAMAGAAFGGGSGWLGPRVMYTLGRGIDNFAPRKDTLRAVFSKPWKWKLAFQNRAVDRMLAAQAAGAVDEKAVNAVLETLGRNEKLTGDAATAFADATKATTPKANALVRWFRPRLSDIGKNFGEESALRTAALEREARHLGLAHPSDLDKVGKGRLAMNIGGPLLGAFIGALEPTTDQGRQGR